MKRGFVVLLVCALALLCGAVALADGPCGDGVTWTLDSSGVLTISGEGDMTSHPWRASDVREVVIESGVTSIADDAFGGCEALTHITIPDSVTSIGMNAFHTCTALTDITIPDSVTSIGGGAFNTCTALADIIIPDSVTDIGDYTFFLCSSLRRVDLLEGLTAIPKAMFSNCETLTGVAIPSSVTTIGDEAFSYCSGLTEINLPGGVTTIGNGAFCGCSALTEIDFPDSATSVGTYIFSFCSALRRAALPEGLTAIPEGMFNECVNLTTIAIPGGVTDIGGWAFANCSDLTAINIPDGVTGIGEFAFYTCSGLREIAIPSSVTSIGAHAFDHCSSLAQVILADGVASIGDSAFGDCSDLRAITFPASVTSIGNSVFIGAYGQSHYALEKIAILADSETEVSFGSGLFGSATPTVYCYEFSAAEAWARRNGYPCVLLDSTTPDDIRTVFLDLYRSLECGESYIVPVCVFPDARRDITWASSDPDIASVDNGVVTAHAPGEVTITAMVGGASANMYIRTYARPTSFDLDTQEAWLVAKQQLQLSVVNVLPANAETYFSWNSSDTDVATVTNGLVTTWRPGDVVITATESNTGLQREALLHVCYPVTEVSLDAPAEMPTAGETLQLTAHATTRTQVLENRLVSFLSSDASVATVDGNGLLTAHTGGHVTITAEASEDVRATIDITVLCAKHTSETDSAEVPTCEQGGWTEGSHCAVCGAVLVARQPLPPDPDAHDWGEPAYSWADDYLSNTATHTCMRNAAHTRSETARAALVLAQAPTEDEAGSTTYVATFENEAFAAQSVTFVDIPPLSELNVLRLPGDLTEIDEEAFMGLNVEAVIIPEGCEIIGPRAFAGCSRLLYVRFPTSTTQVEPDAFADCGSLRLIRLPRD